MGRIPANVRFNIGSERDGLLDSESLVIVYGTEPVLQHMMAVAGKKPNGTMSLFGTVFEANTIAASSDAGPVAGSWAILRPRILDSEMPVSSFKRGLPDRRQAVGQVHRTVLVPKCGVFPMPVRMPDSSGELVLKSIQLSAVRQTILAGIVGPKPNRQVGMKTGLSWNGLNFNNAAHRSVSVKNRRRARRNAEAPNISQRIEIRNRMSHQAP